MTHAVCIRCGTEKFGAWTPCPQCRFTPETDEDMAKSVILTDHHINHEGLKQVAALLQSGGEFDYPPELVASWKRQDLKSVSMNAVRGGCLKDLGCLLLTALILVSPFAALMLFLSWLIN